MSGPRGPQSLLVQINLPIVSMVKFERNLNLMCPNTVCARFTDSVSDAIKRALGLW